MSTPIVSMRAKIRQLEAKFKGVRQDFEDERWKFLCDALEELERRVAALESKEGM